MTAQPCSGDAKKHSHVTYIDGPLEHEYVFTICTLLLRDTSYDRLLESFEKFGFNPSNTQFLAVDNRDGNKFDGYGFPRRCLPDCRGKYVIFCHDDIELIDDGFDDLVKALEALEQEDPNWMVAGGAGGKYRSSGLTGRDIAFYLSDPSVSNHKMGGPFPSRVESLDECFFIVPRERMVANAVDLEGFHFFGTDICMQADLAGGSSYVVPFHFYHHGKAKRDETYYDCYENFTRKYRKIYPGRVVQTTTRKVVLAGKLAPTSLLIAAKRYIIGPR